jgi:hypothetical protein
MRGCYDNISIEEWNDMECNRASKNPKKKGFWVKVREVFGL